ncbi:cellobiose phosphorylase [Bacillus spongiae]|uniref:Cellobiose phosphorylase n=1 Tax=Bacillus spongiae TaxID=2683610 RepID=A0ABU8HDQ2_9BACI
MSKGNYYFDDQKRFVIENYDKAKTFSSFLPGIAGFTGIPMWTFYVNRGQGISSFGVEDKNSPILEFSPANIAYKTVATAGFRTFIKINNDEVYEAFRPTANADYIQRKMYIEANQLSIEEINQELGLKIMIQYFNMPEAKFAGLVRKVSIKNLKDEPVELEVLDGLPEILPFGVTNAAYKEVGSLMRSWMEVYHLDEKVPYYRVRASIGDEAEVNEVTSGHFYLSFSDDEKLITPIVDSEIIFGEDTSLLYPESFDAFSLTELTKAQQVTANKVPCGFTPVGGSLKKDETVNIRTIIGHVTDFSLIKDHIEQVVSMSYIDQKQNEAIMLTRELTNSIGTETGSQLFDEYSRQSYLDNLLRGGYPYIFENEEEDFVYHVFSRKHGDLERDYNFFKIAPEYFSQGNGNFRDANQNRRNDIYFNPKVGSFNTKMFMSFIQADGYNPLSVKGCSFEIQGKNDDQLDKILTQHFASHQKEFKALLAETFTPGKLISFLTDNQIQLKAEPNQIVSEVMKISKQNFEASFGEGYWIDHWTYNMDLIESYLNIYPDKQNEFLFEDSSYTFFDSPVSVLPRSEKYVLSNGKVRQFGSVIEDEEKMSKLRVTLDDTNWLRTKHGQGEIYQTNLFAKLVSLSLMKFSTLDPAGIGVEMEANKPGWNDALNGLPGIFGSGVSETFELKRILSFILNMTKEYQDKEVSLPIEMVELLRSISQLLEQKNSGNLDDFAYWDNVSSAREKYRKDIHFGIDGEEKVLSLQEIATIYQSFIQKVDLGIEKAEELGDGLYPTYLTFEAEAFESVKDEAGNEVVSSYGLPKANVTKFSNPTPLPSFLEGPARALKSIDDNSKAREIYQKVRNSDLFDQGLKMYKTSVGLEKESHEIGRIKAFTPGWLERESNFLHMSYKYLLALLKSGLSEEYFTEIQTALIPFLDPKIYGRSTLENSSFIATSTNPDEKMHGRGFVARLSGSTAEFLSMWKVMMMGKELFQVKEGKLTLTLSPILPKWLFNESGLLTFMFLGQTKVTYYNRKKLDTFGTEKAKVTAFELVYRDGTTRKVESAYLQEDDALSIRKGAVAELHVTLD